MHEEFFGADLVVEREVESKR